MDRRPTVCHVVHSLDIGGAECLASHLAMRLRHEFDAVFMCLDREGSMANDFREAGFGVHLVNRRPGFDIHCIRRIRSVLLNEHVDFVHAHQYAPFFYAALGRIFSSRQPILFTEHGRDYPDRRRPRRVIANKVILRSRDRVVAVGENVRQALIDNEGIDGDRIQVILNGIDTGYFSSTTKSRDQVRRELEISDRSFVILQVARLNELKDHTTAFSAMVEIRKSVPSAILLLVGDGEERRRLEQRVSELRAEEFVRFLGQRNDIPALLSAADLFLLTSVTEGIPLTLLEAMAAGLASVCTDVGGVSEVLLHEKTGLLARASDPEDVAASVVRLAKDSRLRRELAQEGRNRALRLFDQERMDSAYRNLYWDMLGSYAKRERSAVSA